MTDQSKQRRCNKRTCKICDGYGVYNYIETVGDWRGCLVSTERVFTDFTCRLCGGDGQLQRGRKRRVRRWIKAGKQRMTQWLLRMGRAAGVKHYPPLPMPLTYGIMALDGVQWVSYGRVRHKSMLSAWIPCPFNCTSGWIQEFELNGHVCHVCGGKERVRGVRTWKDLLR